jgi:hypothetical protein
MFDRIFLFVSDIERSITSYTATFSSLRQAPNAWIMTARMDRLAIRLEGFWGKRAHVFFWLRQGVVDGRAVHVGFVANGQFEVDAAYALGDRAGKKLGSRSVHVR